ncbi:Periplasmic component of the Tol biopolymer transport system [Neorhizobium galegae bv. officinalis bv. officinalis str. HAMBI 1141]|uniref:Periplasmic component of the Tol biopolymer transport system n=1 Tax=Neorhizobium galegae bv. officinalis bv. officinalis str. HAMBI 1141 TaxID=1028801 RepID=A0A068T9J7_NEOGA|nr:TolB family protein [Neorhizobium galegae]CDN54000.1 Periplasmic component of the Tol biopolymer transport system [Neorhizobium galegae bv. officinalis bv. officinalis str. HAMBI 1141]
MAPRSSVEIFNIRTRAMRVVWQTEALFEAPNWSPDGRYLMLNSEGLIYRLSPDGDGEPEPVDTGFARQCNNDHGISPDGSLIAISDKVEFGKSTIYVLPAGGGVPRLVTRNLPSYWHGWSPDGKNFAYCGIRGDEFDIYTIGIEGGAEKRLTFGEGRNDGPDYSPDGKWIYFNSSRTGLMQIWRVPAAGGAAERITDGGYGDWFPHPSPKGDKIVFVSYDADVFDHPRDLDVRVRLMDMDGGNVETLFELFGGQGTMNSPNWSPDGDEFAYVRYFPVA